MMIEMSNVEVDQVSGGGALSAVPLSDQWAAVLGAWPAAALQVLLSRTPLAEEAQSALVALPGFWV